MNLQATLPAYHETVCLLTMSVSTFIRPTLKSATHKFNIINKVIQSLFGQNARRGRRQGLANKKAD